MVAIIMKVRLLICIILCFDDSVAEMDEEKIKSIMAMSVKSPHPIFLRHSEVQESTTTEGVVKTNCVCSKIYDPVCASNGKSYYNQCQMDCQGGLDKLTVVHQGNCIPF